MPPLTTPLTLSTPRRQAVFYALLYAGTGASLPFMPLWLKTHGMSAGQIGIILAVPLLLRALSGPISGLWADSFRLYRTPLVVLALSGACFYALMSLGTLVPPMRFAAYLVLFTLGYTCMASVSPLIDAMTLQLSRREHFTYAIPRAVGSSAFILTNIVLGYVLLILPPDSILVWIVVAATLTAIGGRYLLGDQVRPDIHHVDTPRQTGWQRLRVLMRDEGFLWLMIAVGCLQASHSFYYAFSTIIWKERGLSSGTCGYLWAVGVVAEVAFMWLGEGIRRQVGPWRMLVLAGLFAVMRWGIMAMSPPLWVLYPLQALHALSFAATYLAGLELIHRLTPKGYEGLAQTMNAAYASGVMMGIGTLASGAIYQVFAARGYGVMAGVAGIGLLSALWMYSQRDRLMAINPTVPAPGDAG
ncbi:MFS transporter [Asticcacaulis sp. 201]|uniref:MFS transporter n=1 Tax=Asticcacaulis sp. 201 TaxID=3028787 RepID=UPI0029165826|nr:MFS transporter [Asticcacaulis sp. 201]MDV6332598.1 MFS transporter [Asticcacaulis sp. 201]